MIHQNYYWIFHWRMRRRSSLILTGTLLDGSRFKAILTEVEAYHRPLPYDQFPFPPSSQLKSDFLSEQQIWVIKPVWPVFCGRMTHQSSGSWQTDTGMAALFVSGANWWYIKMTWGMPSVEHRFIQKVIFCYFIHPFVVCFFCTCLPFLSFLFITLSAPF